MTNDPVELERARERLAQLRTLSVGAHARARHPPRISSESWRGPAFEAYSLAADLLDDRLRAAASALAHAEQLARGEVARVVSG